MDSQGHTAASCPVLNVDRPIEAYLSADEGRARREGHRERGTERGAQREENSVISYFFPRSDISRSVIWSKIYCCIVELCSSSHTETHIAGVLRPFSPFACGRMHGTTCPIMPVKPRPPHPPTLLPYPRGGTPTHPQCSLQINYSRVKDTLHSQEYGRL